MINTGSLIILVRWFIPESGKR